MKTLVATASRPVLASRLVYGRSLHVITQRSPRMGRWNTQMRWTGTGTVTPPEDCPPDLKWKPKKQVSRWAWSADIVKKAGEEVLELPLPPLIELTDEIIFSPPQKIQDMVQEFLNLDILEVNQYHYHLQNRMGYTQAAMDQINGMKGGGGGGGGAGGEAEEVVEAKVQDAFSLKITVAVDAKVKIKVIKEVRSITGLGLKEAKDLVEKAPCIVKDGLKKEEADSLLKVLVEAGAVVELV